MAKQGSNANANISEIQAKIGSPATGQPSTLFAAIAAGGGGGGGGDAQESTSQEILEAMQSIIGAHVINGFNYGDVVFNNYAPVSFIDAYMHLGDIIEINDYSIYNFYISASPLLNIPRINLYNVEYVGATSVLHGNWVYLNMPKLRTLGRTYGSRPQKAQELHIPELAAWENDHGATFDQNSPDLILIEFGAKLTSSCNVFATWNPINALSSSSTSLIKPDETFASNLEKFLYNMRTYIAANLPDRTGLSALTLTFSSAVKAAINADTATAQAFSNKNWTIA